VDSRYSVDARRRDGTWATSARRRPEQHYIDRPVASYGMAAYEMTPIYVAASDATRICVVCVCHAACAAHALCGCTYLVASRPLITSPVDCGWGVRLGAKHRSTLTHTVNCALSVSSHWSPDTRIRHIAARTTQPKEKLSGGLRAPSFL
jgi:hypothetical protein